MRIGALASVLLFVATWTGPAQAQNFGDFAPLLNIIINETLKDQQQPNQAPTTTPRQQPQQQQQQGGLSRSEVMSIQAALEARGIPTGGVDGAWGQKTTAAVRTFQASFGFEVTGTLTRDQMVVLLNSPAPIAVAPQVSPVPEMASGGFEILQNIDLPENDYRSGMRDPSLKDITLDQCQAACGAEGQCQAFTFNAQARVCFLKSVAGVPQPFQGAVSGRRLASSAPAISVATTGVGAANPVPGAAAPAAQQVAAVGTAAPTVGVAPVTATYPLQANVNAIPQIWYGPAVCEDEYGRARKAEAALRYTSRDDGNLDGYMQLYFEPSLRNGTEEHWFLGETTSEGIRFVYTDNRGGRRLGEFQMAFAPDGQRATATFVEGPCQSVTLASPAAAIARYMTTIDPPANGGSYFATADTRQRCEILIDWASRVDTEYPEIAKESYFDGDTYQNVAMLMGDEDFIPVFGRAFDMFSADERWDMSQEAKRMCGRDPFTREAFNRFDIIFDRGLNSSDLGSFGYQAIIDTVRDQRSLRHEILETLYYAELGNHPDLSRSITAALSTVSSGDLLWPSEKTELTARLKGLLAEQSLAEAQAKMGSLAMITDAAAGLDATAAARNVSFVNNLAASDKTAYLAAIDGAEQRHVATLTAPMVERAAALPRDISGAVALQEIMDDELDVIDKASTATREAIVAGFAAQRDAIVDEYLDRQHAQLNAMESTLAGIEDAIALYEATGVELGDLRSLPAFATFEMSYEARRLTLIKGSVAEFETKLALLPDLGAKQDLLAQYFSDPSDRKDPIYLDYLFALEDSSTVQ